jgi:hypothetical protein
MLIVNSIRKKKEFWRSQTCSIAAGCCFAPWSILAAVAPEEKATVHAAEIAAA